MAFSRKALKAMGLTDEQVDSIVEMHTEVTDALKNERNTYKDKAEQYDTIKSELDSANDKLAKYGEDGQTVPKADFDNLQTQFDNYKAEQTAKEIRQAKETALRAMYKGIGISEKRIESVMKVTNLDDIELDKDGKIKDEETRQEAAKTEWADFIETKGTKGADTPNPPATRGNGGTMTKEEIMAIKDGALRRQKMAENPTLFGIK